LDSSIISAFRWRAVGPSNFIGRVSDLQCIPGPSKTLYFAAACGGIYKSTDGGAHWTHLSQLRLSQHIGRIVVDPRNANTVYVAALGPAWKSGGERGLYKSTDGGQTFTLILPGKNASTGAIDVAMDPSNPDVLFASMWERYRTPFSLNSGGSGQGSGLFKSTDGGRTWNEIKGNGYPEGPKGRIGIAISRSNPQVVYALTEAASIAP